MEFFNEAVKKLTESKYKKDIDFKETKLNIRRSFSKVKMEVTTEWINSLRGIDDCARKIRTFFSNNEPETNLVMMKEKYPNYGIE